MSLKYFFCEKSNKNGFLLQKQTSFIWGDMQKALGRVATQVFWNETVKMIIGFDLNMSWVINYVFEKYKRF